ncbi:MAG TPA: PucR family transcriptional regulator [Mycobacterium sp.]|jgi:purine catabolism regulator|nr:PucR family transcriptional regulator [Mycobacterium sp.]
MVQLRTIVEIDELNLRVVHGSDLLDVELSGAHASEQPDPTPWLAGGELLMSDGLGIRPNARQQVDYAARLKLKRVAALVLGLGGSLPYSRPPKGLVDGARAHGLPLLTVPVTTPFIAITQAVYGHMADERVAMSERILSAYAPLTSAAASVAPILEIASAMGQLIDGWVGVYGIDGHAIVNPTTTMSDPASAVKRYLARSEGNELRTSLVESSDNATYAMVALGIDRPRAVLMYGRSEGGLGEQFTHSVSGYAARLLSIEMERRHAVAVLERRPGAEVVRRLLSGADNARAAQALSSVGMTSDRVQVLSAWSAMLTPDDLADVVATAVPGALVLISLSGVKAIVPADQTTVERLRAVLVGTQAGLGGPVRPHHCQASYRQARQAQAESRRRGNGLVEAMGLGNAQVLLQLVTPDGLATFADAVLGAVENAHNGAALTKSLRSFLASGATIEQGSSMANVHRHTMRRHLRRVEELTGRRLDNPRDRTELWLAFEARDVAATL